jgi:hypothetical protein
MGWFHIKTYLSTLYSTDRYTNEIEGRINESILLDNDIVLNNSTIIIKILPINYKTYKILRYTQK